MTDEELKQKAEKAIAKMALIQERILNEATENMSEEEKAKFGLYYLAGLGAVKAMVDDNDDEIDFNMVVDGIDAAYEMVYENDQKPEWDA